MLTPKHWHGAHLCGAVRALEVVNSETGARRTPASPVAPPPLFAPAPSTDALLVFVSSPASTAALEDIPDQYVLKDIFHSPAAVTALMDTFGKVRQLSPVPAACSRALEVSAPDLRFGCGRLLPPLRCSGRRTRCSP